MDRKERTQRHNIKSERVKSFFIHATKEIVLKEGLEGVSVRKVADMAGYSYATIYNYFNDVNDLLWETKTSMIDDVIEYMNGACSQDDIDIQRIKQMNRKYAEYYLERPSVFRFLYSFRIAGNSNFSPAQSYGYASSWHETYKGFVANGTIAQSDVEIIAKTIIYALHGLLTLYFSDNGLTKELVFDELDKTADLLLKSKRDV